jgi:hypothetical protein
MFACVTLLSLTHSIYLSLLSALYSLLSALCYLLSLSSRAQIVVPLSSILTQAAAFSTSTNASILQRAATRAVMVRSAVSIAAANAPLLTDVYCVTQLFQVRVWSRFQARQLQ